MRPFLPSFLPVSSALGLALALALSAPASHAQQQLAAFANHPLVGTWRLVVPGGNCVETYRFRADGTSVVTSGEEVAESEYSIALKPTRDGYYEWVDTIVKDNGKKDCGGQVTDVGRKTVNYIRFDSAAQRLIVCRAESLNACIGPLQRVGGQDI